MGTHTVSTSGLTYFAYLPMDDHRVFKIHFIEYSSGVLFFEYQELVFENQDSLPCEVAITSDDQELVSIITCDAADTSLYLNLVNVAEDTLDWHLSYRNIPVDGGYYMPSISMNAYIAVDSVNQFSDITSSPSPESFVITTTDIEYEGTHAALTYNMGCLLYTSDAADE